MYCSRMEEKRRNLDLQACYSSYMDGKELIFVKIKEFIASTVKETKMENPYVRSRMRAVAH